LFQAYLKLNIYKFFLLILQIGVSKKISILSNSTLTDYQIIDKTPEKLIFSGASKNKFFLIRVHVQHELTIQKNMEKHYLQPP